jgi:hypothetical protein
VNALSRRSLLGIAAVALASAAMPDRRVREFLLLENPEKRSVRP